ncbi:class I SAM-dependent methyltransferase [Marivibrio halodurans]|uniref:Class I SAM-dependent methyltransferase n=1 Tax=Marivibrio halodurans TaxID=2039722 RepID=A0A8J7S2G6_9PROT|nr:class I SAM-dependent methyltransferase [Marivibrio halodurans]
MTAAPEGGPSAGQPNAGQYWDPVRYRAEAGFVATLGLPVVEWLAPVPGERVLDLGCGEGALTAKLAALGCVVTGVDASPDQIAIARAEGLDAHVVDGHALSFESEFDAVFSNAALHWMKRDPGAVVAGVARALKPGGRFVAEMGGDGNVATLRGALHAELRAREVDPAPVDPWYFPTPAAYEAHLAAAGFEVTRMEHFARPTSLPGDVLGWLATFAECFTNALPATDRAAALEAVRARVEADLRDPATGGWQADYVRLRLAARKVG